MAKLIRGKILKLRVMNTTGKLKKYTIIDSDFEQGMIDFHNLLFHAFNSLYSIRALDDWAKANDSGKDLPGNVNGLLNHNREVLKRDLAVSICKMLDDDKKSGSIYQLQKKFKDIINDKTVQMPTEIRLLDKNCLARMRIIRNEFLAHIQMNRAGTSVSIDEMEMALKIIADHFYEFAEMCDPNEKFRLYENDHYFSSVHLGYYLGYLEMLSPHVKAKNDTQISDCRKKA